MMFRFIFFFLSFTLCIASHAQTIQYHEGLTIYSEMKAGKTQYGFKNKSGKIVIPARFDGIANPFNGGQAIIILNNLYTARLIQKAKCVSLLFIKRYWRHLLD
jgi:hypothetical protein